MGLVRLVIWLICLIITSAQVLAPSPAHSITHSLSPNHLLPGGGGVLAREFARFGRPAARAPPAGNREKSTHHRCKIYVKPTHNGQKFGHFEGKQPFFTPSLGKISKKVPMIGAGMPKKAPIIGGKFFKNPPIRAAHPQIPEVWEYTPRGNLVTLSPVYLQVTRDGQEQLWLSICAAAVTSQFQEDRCQIRNLQIREQFNSLKPRQGSNCPSVRVQGVLLECSSYSHNQ